MKKLILFGIFAVILFTSCEKHHRVRLSGENFTTENYAFPDQNITGISVGDAATVYVSKGDTDAIVVEVDEEAFPYLVVRRSGENVVIYFENVSFWGRQPELTVFLTVKDLKELNLSGAATGYLEGKPFVCDNLYVHLSGSSELYGNLDALRVSATIDGSSKMELSGQSTQIDVNASGSSKSYGYEMFCNHLDATLSGESRMECTVLETLSCTLSGSGILRYDGDPEIIYRKISGGAKLRRR